MKTRESIHRVIKNPAKRRKLLLTGSGFLIITGWLVNWFTQATHVFSAFMIAAALIAGYDIAQRALRGLRNRQTNIELLVTIAAAGGIFIKEYWEAAAVTFLFLLGAWLETRSLNKSRSALRELINLAPKTAILLQNGNEVEIPAHQVQADALLLVKPGASIPADGVVVEGSSAVDESPITGEPIPVEKIAGSKVYAGTMNANGLLKIKATQAGADTTLAKIMRRVEEAQEEKAPAQRFIERFASWYTPSIVGLSILSYSITQNLELALTLLVIGCPGALVISTPISIMSGIGRSAKNGILIKGGEYLENAGKVTALALDKTGTLTHGKPRVTDILVFSPVMASDFSEADDIETDRKERELLYLAGIAESGSEHPLAQAVVQKAQNYFTLPKPSHFEALTGFGIRAEYNSNHILIGNKDLMRKSGIEISKAEEEQIASLSDKGQTVVLMAVNGVLTGALGIADAIKPQSAGMIKQLRKNGVNKIVMLTGDDYPAAKAIAAEAGIYAGDVYARMLPEDKLEAIRQLQEEGHIVAMIGDGINDAPALAKADISMAMGAAGTDVAIETADIALMNDDLQKIPLALKLSRLTIKNIRQNVVIALITVFALLGGVLAGSVHMAGGMLIHQLSVMLVILNGMRLQFR